MEAKGQLAVPREPEDRKLRGEVVYVYAFDVAYDMKRQRLRELFGQAAQEFAIGQSRRSPKQWFFYRPDMVCLPTVERQTARGPMHISRTVKVFNIGAISIQMRVPFEVDGIADLLPVHQLLSEDESLRTEVRGLAEEARQQLEPFCIRPVSQLGEGEDYTVVCLHEAPVVPDGSGNRAADWLSANRREIGALLAQEQDAAQLSDQEIDESIGRYLTYYSSDLAVVNWDAALVVGERETLDEVLHVVELANVQLLELGVYDRVLDASLDRAYRDLDHRSVKLRREVQRNLREIRLDLARLSDELLNTTKFFGDWHLARIYQALSSRFHLSDWHSTIRVKLTTLGELYQLLHQDWINFWMVVLEGSIVLLFVIDVLLLFLGLG
jgi:hypothetical protein